MKRLLLLTLLIFSIASAEVIGPGIYEGVLHATTDEVLFDIPLKTGQNLTVEVSTEIIVLEGSQGDHGYSQSVSATLMRTPDATGSDILQDGSAWVSVYEGQPMKELTPEEIEGNPVTHRYEAEEDITLYLKLHDSWREDAVYKLNVTIEGKDVNVAEEPNIIDNTTKEDVVNEDPNIIDNLYIQIVLAVLGIAAIFFIISRFL